MGHLRVPQVIQYLGLVEMDRNEAASSGLLAWKRRLLWLFPELGPGELQVEEKLQPHHGKQAEGLSASALPCCTADDTDSSWRLSVPNKHKHSAHWAPT